MEGNTILRKLPCNNYGQSKAKESTCEVTEIHSVVRKKEQGEVHLCTWNSGLLTRDASGLQSVSRRIPEFKMMAISRQWFKSAAYH